MSSTPEKARGWLLDLERNVRKLLPQKHGGTGNDRGFGTAVVAPFSNGAGATLAIGTLVKLKATYDDNRVIATTTTADIAVGVVVGSYVDDDGLTFQAVAPAANVQAAVLIAGVVEVTITGTVTRGQYAYPSGTSGAATSSATASPGAFGQFIVSSSSGIALVIIGSPGVGGGGATFGTPALTLTTANAAGAASTAIRTDASILAFDATVPAAIGTAATGAAAVAARRDHVHGAGGGTPATQAVGDTGSNGTGPAAAFYDHQHPLTRPALDALSDVVVPSPAVGDVLYWDGANWVDTSPGAFPNIWRPLMDGAVPGTIILNGANGEAIMAYGPA